MISLSVPSYHFSLEFLFNRLHMREHSRGCTVSGPRRPPTPRLMSCPRRSILLLAAWKVQKYIWLISLWLCSFFFDLLIGEKLFIFVSLYPYVGKLAHFFNNWTIVIIEILYTCANVGCVGQIWWRHYTWSLKLTPTGSRVERTKDWEDQKGFYVGFIFTDAKYISFVLTCSYYVLHLTWLLNMTYAFRKDWWQFLLWYVRVCIGENQELGRNLSSLYSASLL